MKIQISYKDLLIMLIPIESLLLAYTTLYSTVWIIIKLLLAIPSLFFIPGYTILTNILDIKRFGYEEYIYSTAISVSTIVLSGYLIDTLKQPLPYQFFIIISCTITLLTYLYTFIRNYNGGKIIGR